jgi:hypothetical protein
VEGRAVGNAPTGMAGMTDLLYLAIILLAGAVSLWYVRATDRL